jgi:uncharacterized protein DUF1902
MARPVVVHADWDPEAAVWVATSQDIRGLATEADTFEAPRAKLPAMIFDLLDESGISDFPASIEIIARKRSFAEAHGCTAKGSRVGKAGGPHRQNRNPRGDARRMAAV